jgi:hypothetical protein
MEISPEIPVWLTWMAAGSVGLFAAAALARMLEAMLDLDPS